MQTLTSAYWAERTSSPSGWPATGPCASVENVYPMARLVAMNSVLNAASSANTDDRHVEQHHTGAYDERRLEKSDQHVRHDFAQHDLERRDRHREQALHSTTLDLTRDRQRCEDQHRHGQNGAHQSRHDIELACACRVVARVCTDFERHLPGIRNCTVVVQRRLQNIVQRTERGAARDRIGRVCRDQNRRMVTTTKRAFKAARHFDCEQHFARGQHAIELGLVVHLMRDFEVFGV